MYLQDELRCLVLVFESSPNEWELLTIKQVPAPTIETYLLVSSELETEEDEVPGKEK